MAKYIVVQSIKITTDFAPETFGRLTTIGPKFRVNGRSMQVCECSCGQTGVYDLGNMKAGRTQSCGCLNRENIKTKTIKHGHSANGVWSPEYRSYVGMCSRCLYPKNNRFATYAERGIGICPRWREPKSQGFLNFLADMGHKPDPSYSIERINVNGNYEPGNCKWGTSDEQANNKTNNVYITHDGITQTVAQWAKQLGIKRATIAARLRSGWSPSDCLTRPIRIDSRNKI